MGRRKLNDNLNKDAFKNSWKGYSFDTINELTDKGYLFPSKYNHFFILYRVNIIIKMKDFVKIHFIIIIIFVVIGKWMINVELNLWHILFFHLLENKSLCENCCSFKLDMNLINWLLVFFDWSFWYWCLFLYFLSKF